ncbi:snEchinoidin [Aphelenchoides avenae]|nr:snEchinoidin [Aphelenchus avenae]
MKNAVWIGLHEQGRKPVPFLWDDGTPLDFTKWDKGQPSNIFFNPRESYNEHCGFLQIEKAVHWLYTWDDAGCRNRVRQPYGVCQIVLSGSGR